MCGWKDVGTAIRKSIVVSFLPCFCCFFGIPSLHGPSFFLMFFCNLYYWMAASSSPVNTAVKGDRAC